MSRTRRSKKKRSFSSPVLAAIAKRPALALIITGVLLVTAIAAVGYPIIASDLPDVGNVNAIAKRQTTIVYAADGSPLSMLYQQNRTIIPLSKISPKIRSAIVAVEDERFYKHGGIDYWGILRAIFRDVTSGELAEGGSTITQQYVKNAYFSQERTLTRKVKEAILSYRLEKNYSKDEILEKYLNTIYLGDGTYGVEAASRNYFDKPASDLTLAESATLVGLVKAPEFYNPHRNPEGALKRRDTVIDQMVALGMSSKREASWAKSLSLGVVPEKELPARAPYFIDWIKESLAKRFGDSALYSQGLRIYTTLDTKMQAAAEKAAAEHLNEEDDPEVAVVAVDPSSGAVKAMVGGRDYAMRKFNLASQGQRQPGSAFKTFTLATAIAEGASPDALYDSTSPTSLEIPGGKTWTVKNYSGYGEGKIDLWRATALSNNVVYARLILEVGAKKVAEFAKKAGISTPVNADPAIALGGLKDGVSPLEMASAYATFANGGLLNEPYGVAKVTTTDGKLLYEHKVKQTRSFDEAVAYLVTRALKNVIDWGTGTSAAIGRPAAGKTGTTDDYSDAWFAGYTPDLAAAVWVGYPDENQPMTDVQGITVTGGSFPARIWSDFMGAALEGRVDKRFADAPPGSLVTVDTCTETGKLANGFCPTVKDAVYLKKYKPKKVCTTHNGVSVPDVTGKDLASAKATVESAGLKWSVEKRISSSPVGLVLEQNPKDGEKVKPDTAVTLIISAGKANVPSVIGLPDAEAVKAIEREGLKVKKVYALSSAPEGTVVNQNPGPGRDVEPGSTVTITISGSATTLVPDVVGKTRAEALSLLENAGYEVDIVEVTDPSEIERAGSDRVVSQSPEGGAELSRGSLVTINVTG